MIFTTTNSATLSSRIAALDAETATDAAALTERKAKWRAAILDGDDAARAVIEDAIGTAERKAAMQSERRGILVAEQEALLERDARDQYGRQHAAQGDVNKKTAASMQKAFRKAWDIVAPELQALADARAATDLLNKAMPTGFAPLRYPDDIARGTAALPRTEISSTMVDRWCFVETGNRVGDQDAVQGGLLHVGGAARPQKCERRRFRHVQYHPAEVAKYAAPISAEIRFPRWDDLGTIFDGSRVIPEGVKAALDAAEARLNQKATRPILEEFISIDDAGSDAA